MAGNAYACVAYSKDKSSWGFVGTKKETQKAGGPKMSYCAVDGKGYKNNLGRAADTIVQPFYSPLYNADLVMYRKDLGTPAGWREVRGARVVFLSTGNFIETVSDSQTDAAKPLKDFIFYPDRMGKLERLRWQIYAMGVTTDLNLERVELYEKAVGNIASSDSEPISSES